jgi:hypothetical protein
VYEIHDGTPPSESESANCREDEEYRAMTQNGIEEGLLVRAEPLEWAKEISQRMVNVVRIVDGALLLDVDPAWAWANNKVLVEKGLKVSELRGGERLNG